MTRIDLFLIFKVYISHDLSVVRAITDRVMVMQSGRIVEEGPSQEVFVNPQAAYTAALINAAPVIPEAWLDAHAGWSWA